MFEGASEKQHHLKLLNEICARTTTDHSMRYTLRALNDGFALLPFAP